MEEKRHPVNFNLMNIATVCGCAFCAWFIIFGINQQLFTSEEALKSFLKSFGIAAPLLFMTIQAVQVVIPIIPGGISCLAGVLIFGPVPGFLYNYIGISIGSVCAFLISRHIGMRAVRQMATPDKVERYIRWMEKGKFDKLFALAILFPVAPDDLLCYLAGTTSMSLKKFTAIILLGKPWSIALYSLGLQYAATKLLGLAG